MPEASRCPPAFSAPKTSAVARRGSSACVAHRNNSFQLRHFAGEVCYSVSSFLERNNESLSADLRALLRGSELSLITKLLGQASAPSLCTLLCDPPR